MRPSLTKIPVSTISRWPASPARLRRRSRCPAKGQRVRLRICEPVDRRLGHRRHRRRASEVAARGGCCRANGGTRYLPGCSGATVCTSRLKSRRGIVRSQRGARIADAFVAVLRKGRAVARHRLSTVPRRRRPHPGGESPAPTARPDSAPDRPLFAQSGLRSA